MKTARAAFRICAALACALCAPPAAADVQCSVTTGGLAFAGYDVYRATDLDVTATMDVQCTLISGSSEDVSYTLALSAGNSGSYLPARWMQNSTVPASRLQYNLFTTSARNMVWGDGNGGSSLQSDTLPTLTSASPTRNRNWFVYGRAPAGQDVAVGYYMDNVVVTVTF